MFIITKLQREDVSQVYELGKGEPNFSVSQGGNFWSSRQLEMWSNCADDVLLVAKEGQQVVGFVLTHHHLPTGKAIIENLLVKEDWRKQGVGAALIKEALRQLKERGVTYVCLFTKSENEEEIEYFTNQGFDKGFNFAWLEKNL